MANQSSKLIGSGIVFPLVIDAKGGIRAETGAELIKSSLRHIFSTPGGTRYFLGEFYSRLPELIEEQNTSITQSLVSFFIKECVTRWEKRIELLEITQDIVDSHKIVVSLRYKILSTQQEDNFIFPFYKQLIY